MSDAIRGVVEEGATLRFLLENDPAAPLIMDGNAVQSGLGVSLFAQGTDTERRGKVEGLRLWGRMFFDCSYFFLLTY